MISFLEGKIILKKEKFVILNVSGVGYKVFLSQKTLQKIPQEGEIIKLFTFLVVRENVMDLYGFLNYDELGFFEILLDISGIGPKAALEISALGPLEKIKKDIEMQNEEIFSGIPGIGKKKIQSIILELSGRIREIARPKKEDQEYDEALEGLVNLGFPRQAAKDALRAVPKEIQNPEIRIKEALKMLGTH